MSFQQLNLHPALLRAVGACGYETPTEIQKKAIPAALAGRDIVASAQTGTGKTAAFVLPSLHRLNASPRPRGQHERRPRMLVLTPTRELAAQVGESVRDLGRFLQVRSAQIFGGVGYEPQTQALRRGLDVLVATPGRLLDHAGQGTADLSRIEILVLDEADRMLDMGFIHDIRKVLNLLPQKRQNLLFSATFPDEIHEIVNGMMKTPERIETTRRTLDADSVAQAVHHVDRERKRELLSHLIMDGMWKQVLVFTRTKHGANKLAEQLCRASISAAAIHGNKSQSARTKALSDFKLGRVRVLVATDIAARGLDIDGLPHVVNFELPNVPEDYVHRIGRTGRAGTTGQAVSLVSAEEFGLMAGIKRILKRDIPVVPVAGFEAKQVAGARSFWNRSSGNGQMPAKQRGGEFGRRKAGSTGRTPGKGHAAESGRRGYRGRSPRRTSVVTGFE
jgi:ATP-dependent RNA helicase RhlE